MADFEAKNVRVQWPCKHVTLLNCGEGDTFVPAPGGGGFPCGMFTNCGRISPVVEPACRLGTIDLNLPTTFWELTGCPGGSREPIGEIFIRPEELTPLKEILQGRLKEIEEQIASIDKIEGQVRGR